MTTARERARAETTEAILPRPARQLAEVGAAALSLRAVAREVGMVSSAVYRYFPSRDELLTALIVEAYDAVGEAAEAARREAAGGAAASAGSPCGGAVRAWAQAHPAQYALIYGSPGARLRGARRTRSRRPAGSGWCSAGSRPRPAAPSSRATTVVAAIGARRRRGPRHRPALSRPPRCRRGRCSSAPSGSSCSGSTRTSSIDRATYFDHVGGDGGVVGRHLPDR